MDTLIIRPGNVEKNDPSSRRRPSRPEPRTESVIDKFVRETAQETSFEKETGAPQFLQRMAIVRARAVCDLDRALNQQPGRVVFSPGNTNIESIPEVRLDKRILEAGWKRTRLAKRTNRTSAGS